LVVLHASIRRIRRRPVANRPALHIRRQSVLRLTSIQPPRIRRTVPRQLNHLIRRRPATTSRQLRNRKETILRLRHERILQVRDSMTVRAMTADLAVVADAVDVTEAETVVAIAEVGSVVVADAIAEAARRDEICRHRNTHHRAPRARHIRRIRRRDHSLPVIVRTISRQRRIIFRQLFCPANRLRSIRSARQ
jgi:hypothetical protein